MKPRCWEITYIGCHPAQQVTRRFEGDEDDLLREIQRLYAVEHIDERFPLTAQPVTGGTR